MGRVPITDTSQATEEILARTIAAMAGPEARPRPDQARAVVELVEHRRRVLVVQATGWGKSAVYWAATAALRQQGAGPTLVVSPLLALMRDQIAAAARAGLRAATINSTNTDEWQSVLAELRGGALDVLLISPERLANPAFAAQLPDLLEACGLLVIDEAHCVSDWGFDFRPDYQRLTRTLLALAPGTPVLATTATANQRVTADVAAQLGEDSVTLRGSLARASLRLAVVPGLSALERYAWVADALRALPGSGIVYVLTVAETERVAGFLRQSRAGRRRLLGPDRQSGGAGGSAAPQRRQGPGGHLGPGHGLRQAGSRLLHPPRLTRLAGGLLPTGRAGRPGPGRRAGGLGAGGVRRADLAVLRHRRHPGRAPDGADPGLHRRRAAERAGHRVGDRHPADPGRGSAQDPGRRRLGRTRSAKAGSRRVSRGTSTRPSGPRCVASGLRRPI